MSSAGNTPRAGKNDDGEKSSPRIVTKEFIDAQREKDWPDVSPQERAFAFEYVNNGYKHREAAVRAGFAESSGLSILRRPLVAGFVRHIQEDQYDRGVITKDFLNLKLMDLYDMAVGEAEVNLVQNGEAFSAKSFNGNLALQILQEQSSLNGVKKSVSIDVDEGSILAIFAKVSSQNITG